MSKWANTDKKYINSEASLSIYQCYCSKFSFFDQLLRSNICRKYWFNFDGSLSTEIILGATLGIFNGITGIVV
jgi:hypothetical protein